MASLILRHKSQTLIPKSHQSIFIFNHFYSSSNSSDNDGNAPVNPPNYPSFAEIKKNLNKSQQSSSKNVSFDDLRKNLSMFKRDPSENTFPTRSISQFPNLVNPNPNPNASFSKGGYLSFEKIRGSLQKMKEKNTNSWNNILPSNNYNNNYRVNGNDTNQKKVIGGSIDSLPSVFRKEIKEKEMQALEEDEVSKYRLTKSYSHADLGEKLKALRPDTVALGFGGKKKKKEKGEEKKEGWFSLSELQQRLGKLKKIDEAAVSKNSAITFLDLRKSIESLQLSNEDKSQRIDILSKPSFMTSPPKEHLVEKYFHPDNMSSGEKMKIKLKKVRDEFKMSESDCGSTRVQIAQLTTEIHHLSSVLHKKDKHSRRGLHAKVQQRKKLLKYLRRTDWDSYCLVLSKLGLRDNPDYKN